MSEEGDDGREGGGVTADRGGGVSEEGDDSREGAGVTADRGGGGGGVRGGGRWQRRWRSDSRSWRGGCQRRGTIAEKVEE